MQSVNYRKNSIKIKKIKDKYILISFTGSWVDLNKKEYLNFKNNDMSDDLFSKLEDNGIIVTDKNNDKIIKDYRNRKGQLFQGTSLHIVVVTLRCNEKCIYCHASSAPIKSKHLDMSIETARKTVDFIFQSPSKAITIEFQGGEPLLNLDAIKEILKYAQEKNKTAKKDLHFSLVTNLSLMTDEIIDYFVKYNLHGICTSLDGPKELHEKNRPMIGTSSYDLTIKWINKLRNHKMIRVNALMTTTKYSLQYAKEIIDEYKELGLRSIFLRHLNKLGVAEQVWSKIGYSAEGYIEFWKESINYIYKKNGILENSSLIMLKKILTDKDPMFLDLMSPCGAAIGQMAYNYNGDIYSCDEARMIKDDIFKLGNVMKNDYKTILTQPKTLNLIASSVNDTHFCNSCQFQPYCGICPVCTYESSSTLIPLLTTNMRCNILKGQFNHLFNKIIFEENFREKIMKIINKPKET